MNILKKIVALFQSKKKAEQPQFDPMTRMIAQHEAAHGIVWYLFRENWQVGQLTIQNENLPDANMNGFLHIFPREGAEPNNIERANELFAIVLAGMIGQNIELIIDRNNLISEIMQVQDFRQILNTAGCNGDFEIASNFLEPLAEAFGVDEGIFTQRKVMDLIIMFQSHDRVQLLHNQLTETLLEKGTLNEQELLRFFDENGFQEYVEDENLDFFNS